MTSLCKILGHRWNACQCARCGAERDRKHRFIFVEGQCLRKCAVCDKHDETPHEWNRCACVRCGEVRDEDHDWIRLTDCKDVCRLCGKEQAKHQWRPMARGVDRCRRCGKEHKLTVEEIAARDEEIAARDEEWGE